MTHDVEHIHAELSPVAGRQPGWGPRTGGAPGCAGRRGGGPRDGVRPAGATPLLAATVPHRQVGAVLAMLDGGSTR